MKELFLRTSVNPCCVRDRRFLDTLNLHILNKIIIEGINIKTGRRENTTISQNGRLHHEIINSKIWPRHNIM